MVSVRSALTGQSVPGVGILPGAAWGICFTEKAVEEETYSGVLGMRGRENSEETEDGTF